MNPVLLSPAERADLEAHGARLADLVESADLDLDPQVTLPPLMELRRLRYQRAVMESQTEQAVAHARQAGLSWHQVGQAIGITGEAARRRYRESTA